MPVEGPKQNKTKAAILAVRSPVRWYACKASDEGLLQVKFAGVPEERLNELLTAALALFPGLRQY